MRGPHLDHEVEMVRSFDGTLLAVRAMGEGDRLPLLVANGIGANLAVWRRALYDLAAEREIVTWDHRGLFDSKPPASDRRDAAAHAEDALAAADYTGLKRFALVSWSSGGPIALQVANRYPDRVAALVLVNAGFGHPAARLIRHLELVSALPMLAGVAKHFSARLQGPFRSFVSRPTIAGIVRQSGLVGPSADIPAVVDLLQGMASCDLRNLLEIYEDVAGESNAGLLAGVEAPTLLVAGSRDPFTPASMLEEMERALPDARLEVYEKATHYLPLEHPARLRDDIRSFVDARG
ncbi:MAG TPA: alpha/beta hydrolase [Actinomycetota bacterium]|nr:alpha/beta hydrolase [Actinomycetota bacterium]